ncbi:MAG: hypothetical protein FCKEOINB_00681 [Nitrosomonas sp.]|nr:hypothetical protein [Nitrosomonas sp.]
MGDRGEVIGFYAVAKLKDGGHCFEFMSQHQINEIRDKSQGAWKDEWENGKKTGEKVKANSPWWDNPVEMGRKTVIRRLAKYLPLSIEFQTAAAIDGMAEAGKDQHLDAIDGDFSIVADDAPIVDFDQETGEITGDQPKQIPQDKPDIKPEEIQPKASFVPSPEEQEAIRQREIAEAEAYSGRQEETSSPEKKKKPESEQLVIE